MLDLTPDAQADYKLDLLLAALSRQGFEAARPELVRGGAGVGYRNRIRLRVDDQGCVVFFNQHKLPSCAVLRRELADALRRLQDLGRVPSLCGAGHVELRLGDVASRIGLCVYGARDADRTLAELRARLPPEWVIAADGAAEEMPCLDYWLREPRAQGGDQGLIYAVPLTSFVQVNSEVNRALVRRLVAEALGAGTQTFIDLFSGAGNFSLALLDAGLRGISVEQNAPAVAALARTGQGLMAARRQAAVAGGRPREHRLLVADARGLATLSQLEPAELLVANPPRAGLFPAGVGAGAPAALARLATRHLALCSCNPASLARDLRALSDVGFKLQRLVAFDMFPGTRHLEALAWLAAA